MQIVIDKEFKDALRELTEDEYAELEKSIIENGCYEPLIIWEGNDILVGGHHRYEICLMFGIQYSIEEISFADRDEVMRFIYKNQIGRRNVSDFTKILQCIGEGTEQETTEDYESMHGLHGSEEVDLPPKIKVPAKKPVYEITGKEKTRIANETGLSETQIAKALRIENEATNSVKASVKSGEMSIHKAYQTLPKPQKDILDKFNHPVSDELRIAFESNKKFTSAIVVINSLIREFKDCKTEQWSHWIRIEDLINYLQNAKRQLSFAKPQSPCPNCKGKTGTGCSYCEGCGYITSAHFNSMRKEHLNWLENRNET